jgi:hypothetical protein
MALYAQAHRDSKALAFAALVTLVLGFTPELGVEPVPTGSALDGVLDARTAQIEGSWWLEDPAATARLGFSPDHGLVWRVEADAHEVVLDATTGEPVEFIFD